MKLLRRVTRTIVVTMISLIMVPIVIVGILFIGFIVIPLPASLPEPRALPISAPTEIFDTNGTLIATFRPYEQNFPVNQSDIPEVLKQAIIAAEDQRFYEHGGVDPKGIARALWKDLRGKSREGGSTITQQYVKNAYTGTDRTIARKVREAVLASQLDRQVEKEDILYRYMSTIYLGNGIYGVGAAAEAYFRKSVKDLTLSEAAMIAGIIPAPTKYEPRGNPARAETQRTNTLRKMHDQQRISDAEYNAALTQVIWQESQGAAPQTVTLIYAAKQDSYLYPYFVDYTRRVLIEKYGQAAVYGGGLKVVTTLDPTLQNAADESVAKAILPYDAPLEMALVSIEPQTGYVKALVGGRDFGKSAVNLALGGCYQPPSKVVDIEVESTCWKGETVSGGGTGRQPGSSFKPFTLAVAFEQGISPEKSFSAPVRDYPPGCKKQTCSIGNSNDGEGGGSMSLRNATVHSVNTVFAPLAREVGIGNVADMAKRLGVTSAFYSPTVHGTSGNYALGTIDVSPLDMASAYSVFANRGQRQEPTPILTVIDTNGKVLEDNTNRQPTRVINENVADNVTDVLRGVITGGTGTKANINRPAAGKTGTTNDYKDAWFVGYTPTLSTAVWMGYSDKPRTMRLKGLGNVFGGTLSAPTWAAYMKRALADVPVTEFSDPAPIKKLTSKQVQEVARQAVSNAEANGLVVIAPAKRQPLSGTDATGPSEEGAGPPSVVTPLTTTTTSTTLPIFSDPGGSSTTTSTTTTTVASG